MPSASDVVQCLKYYALTARWSMNGPERARVLRHFTLIAHSKLNSVFKPDKRVLMIVDITSGSRPVRAEDYKTGHRPVYEPLVHTFKP
jgi:hypothetical protein